MRRLDNKDAKGAKAAKVAKRGQVLCVLCALCGLCVPWLGAQTRFTYSTGQSVSPAYEGWMPNADGSFTMYFGYMNTNWLEEFDIPVGPANDIEPGGPDQGQPTFFAPARQKFLFRVKVPKDWPIARRLRQYARASTGSIC